MTWRVKIFSFIWVQSDVLISSFMIPFFPHQVSHELFDGAVNPVDIEVQQLTFLNVIFLTVSTLCL